VRSPTRFGFFLRRARGRQAVLFEKKNQKTFAYKACALRHRARQWTKVFASFFKKKRFPTSFAPDTNALPRGDRPLSALILYRDGGHGRAL
jgi:hypothetical protein